MSVNSTTPQSEESSLSAVRSQEQRAEKPTLNASPGLGNWLKQVGGSLAFTTYQSARLFLLFAGEDAQTLSQERIMGTAMGLAADEQGLWVSNQQQIWRMANMGPRVMGEVKFDAVYMPRRGYLLGGCDVHDLLANVSHQGEHHELLFVNTRYSCIAALDDHYNFRPVWKPDFISALGPGDRCHLNGMCERDGQLAYVTLCAREDKAMGWRETRNGGGCVVNVRTNEIICDGLTMPHSPRWHADKLWLLNSGEGDFGYVDFARKTFVTVGMCPGFARGLTFVGGYAVIGVSRLRDSDFARGLPIKARLEAQHIQQTCGLLVIDPDTGKLVHWLTIEGSVDELYDVCFLPDILQPYTPGFSEPQLHQALVNLPVNSAFPHQEHSFDHASPTVSDSETAPITARSS
jgi:uncharacterized protein (TIGR03032 family)